MSHFYICTIPHFIFLGCFRLDQFSFSLSIFPKVNLNFLISFFIYIFVYARCDFVATKSTLRQPGCRRYSLCSHTNMCIKMKTNRTEVIKIRVTKEEKRRMMDKAHDENIPLSMLVRKAVLSETIHSNTDVQMVFQMKKIGYNLNQIAHHINLLPVSDNVLSSLKSIDKLIFDINTIIGKLL